MLYKKRSLFSRLWRFCKAALHVNRFEKALRSAKNPTTIFIEWNRGMGDVPLGLYGVNLRIRHFFPKTPIIYYTRNDLLDVFSMLPDCTAKAIPGMKRGKKSELPLVEKGSFLIKNLDPTKDLPWVPGTVIPKLRLPEGEITARFTLQGKAYIGMHIDTETGEYYGYEKNWAKEKWERLIQMVLKAGRTPILFGCQKGSVQEGVIDLRGETTLQEVCSILLEHCESFVAPDSGILSVIYFVESTQPLHIISLWNDPNQGVLRQKVPSPNPSLSHIPLIGLESISPDDVYSHLNFEKGSKACE